MRNVRVLLAALAPFAVASAAAAAAPRQSVPVVPIELVLAEPPAAGERLTWEGTLELRRAEQVVAVSLSDRVSGRTVTSRLAAAP